MTKRQGCFRKRPLRISWPSWTLALHATVDILFLCLAAQFQAGGVHLARRFSLPANYHGAAESATMTYVADVWPLSVTVRLRLRLSHLCRLPRRTHTTK